MALTAVILEREDGKVLFQLRDNIPNILYPGCWGIFGGHIEQGEMPIECAIRELKEELEYEVDESKIKFFTKVKLGSHDLFVFAAPYPMNKKIVFHEGSDAKFFSRDEIKKVKLVPGMINFLEEYWKSK